MTKLTIIISLFFAVTSCTDNKKIIEQSKAMHQDSASIDSTNFLKLKIKDEKLNGILNYKHTYDTSQLRRIFATGKN